MSEEGKAAIKGEMTLDGTGPAPLVGPRPAQPSISRAPGEDQPNGQAFQMTVFPAGDVIVQALMAMRLFKPRWRYSC